MICYVEVGTAGNYYTAAQEGIATTYYAQFEAAGVFGKKLSGYPEHFFELATFCPEDHATTNMNGRRFELALKGASSPCR